MNISLKSHQRREGEKRFNEYIEGLVKIYIATTVSTLHYRFGFGKKRIDKFVEMAYCDDFWDDVERLNKDGATMGKVEQALEYFGLKVNMSGRSMKKK